MDKLVTDIRADIERFRSGADSTLDVENVLDLIAENERLRAGINLHQHDGYAGCTECGKAWPCPTIEATTPAPQPL